jgi:hypothetical protein
MSWGETLEEEPFGNCLSPIFNIRVWVLVQKFIFCVRIEFPSNLFLVSFNFFVHGACMDETWKDNLLILQKSPNHFGFFSYVCMSSRNIFSPKVCR